MHVKLAINMQVIAMLEGVRLCNLQKLLFNKKKEICAWVKLIVPVHVKLPSVLVQTALVSQTSSVAHSSISEKITDVSHF